MQFDHHNMTGAYLAAALVNQPEPWDTIAVEQLLHEHWIRTEAISAVASDELHALADRLRPVFAAPTDLERCEAVNAMLADRGSAYLTVHDDLPPHLHFAPNDDDVVSRVRAFAAGSLAMFLVETGGRRLGACLRAGCRMVFVDTSRNGRRSYCSSRCANHDAVGRHRRRRLALAST